MKFTLPFTRVYKLTKFLLAHPDQLTSVLAAIESKANGAAAAIVSEVATIHADLNNPAYDPALSDLWTLAKTVEAEGFSPAAVWTAVEAVEHATNLLTLLNSGSPAATASASPAQAAASLGTAAVTQAASAPGAPLASSVTAVSKTV